MRRLSYEVFLIGHIIMAIFTIVGSWYHLILRFGKTGTHEYWLYAAFAVWALDHVLRMLRILNNGFQRATITEVGPHHVRVEIPSVRFANKPACHGYVYFPTVQPLRPWENHPFSVNSTAVLHSFRAKLDAGPGSPTSSFHDADSKDNTATKTNSTVATSRIAAGETRASPGVTLYVRKSTGMTRRLQNHNSLLALLDGPYPNNPAEHVLSCERLLLIGGGIGITGLLGFMSGGHANVKLAWSVKAEAAALVADLEGVVKSVGEREVKVGERLNVNALLREEVRMGWGRVGVVVCGPGGLCDDVRAEVARLGRHEKTVFELEVDAFSW
jgi:predicted ferric reductase